MPHIDFNQPPFDVLTLSERQSIRKNTSIRYLEKNERLPTEELQHLYVVMKGQIEQRLDDRFVASYLGSNHSDELNNNDWFDSRRLPKSTNKQSEKLQAQTVATTETTQPYQFYAVEDTLLLQVNGAAVDKISAQNHLIRQILSDKLPEKLKALQQRRSKKPTTSYGYDDQQEVQQIMLQPVIDVHLLPVHIVDASQSLFEAADVMTKAGLKHVLVRPLDASNHAHHKPSGTGHLLGILTDTDICRAVS